MLEELVSIIMPVYQSANYLERAVKSVLAQTYRPIEILLIDDGSDEDVAVLCDEFAKKYKEVHIYHREHQGVSAARNYGISQAKGKYIQFVDADDEMCPHMTELLMDTLQKNQAYMSVCGYEVIDGQKRRQENFEECTTFAGAIGTEKLYEIIKGNVLSVVWNKLYIKERIRHMFDESLILCEDSVFCTEYFIDNPKLAMCQRILYQYYLNRDHWNVKGQRVFGYDGIKKYYFRNRKLVKEIIDVSKKQKAQIHIGRVFFYGVYTYIFEALPYSDLRRTEKIALMENIMRDRVYQRNILGISKLYWKEKCYRFASKVQNGNLLYRMVCLRKCLLKIGKKNV